MGTRGVTIVISDKKTKVAQYGQWDHYPSGQGVTILNFLLNSNMDKFKEQLSKCRFTDKEKKTEIENFLKSIGSTNGWLTGEQSVKFNEKYPYFTRDLGGQILNEIYESTDEVIWLQDSKSFVKDGLFCEYAYIVDLDKGTFEIYEGFNKNPDNVAKRFKRYKTKGEYCPPSLMKIYKLDSLPNIKTFIEELEPKEDEETEE